MKQINCELTDEQYILLEDILGHVAYDDKEAKDMMILRSKLLD